MKNLKEFKALIKRYKSITLDEIISVASEKGYFDGGVIANEITGYGDYRTCTLCSAVKFNCDDCVWSNTTTGENLFCNIDNNEDTYCNITYAETPEELLSAFRARAEHMKKVLKDLK